MLPDHGHIGGNVEGGVWMLLPSAISMSLQNEPSRDRMISVGEAPTHARRGRVVHGRKMPVGQTELKRREILSAVYPKSADRQDTG